MKNRIAVAAGMLACVMLAGCAVWQEPGQSRQMPPESSVSVSAPAASQEEVVPAVVAVEVTKSTDELIARSEGGEWAWFDDVVMIGDSVSL